MKEETTAVVKITGTKTRIEFIAKKAEIIAGDESYKAIFSPIYSYFYELLEQMRSKQIKIQS